MKHLLATTAILAVSAGIASAEITVTGEARMGIVDTYGDVGAQFSSRVRIIFTATGETDSGLSFGAKMRADQNGGNADGTRNGDSTVFISGAFGKLTMGDVDGASQAAVGQVDGVGFTGLGDLNEIAFVGTGGADELLFDANFAGNEPISTKTSILYEYSTGDFTIYASSNQLEFTLPVSGYSHDRGLGIAAAYTTGAYKLSIGYDQVKLSDVGVSWDVDQISVGADATFGSISLKARYATGGVDGTNGFVQDNDQWAASATYTMDSLAMTAFVSQQDFTQSGTTVVERDAYGLGASYDLGGGAKVSGGYVKNDTDDTSAVDVGLNFSF